MNKAARACVFEFGLAMAAYAVVLIVSITILNANPHALWRIPVALAPVVPVCFALWAFMRFLGRMDELQQRIQLHAIGFGFGATALVTFSYGFLENVGLPHISWIWVTPLMVVLWGIGGAVAAWRYR